jgi:hypothetical protein
LPFPEISKRYNVPETAIRTRSSREEWPIPRSIMARAQRQLKEARQAQLRQLERGDGVAGEHLREKVSQMARVQEESPLRVISESAVTYGQRSQMAILAGMAPQIEQAMSNPEAFTPASVKELVALGSLLHKLSGLDKEGAQVRVSVAMFSEGAKAGAVIEADSWADVGGSVNT